MIEPFPAALGCVGPPKGSPLSSKRVRASRVVLPMPKQ